jgi:uncharacterized protein
MRRTRFSHGRDQDRVAALCRRTPRRALQHGQDLAEALKWYSRAAAQGHTGAMVTLDEREKEEAAREDARSRFNLGKRFFCGRDVPQSYEEAARLYRIAAAQGHGEAHISLGSMYENGLGVARDFAE